MALRVLKDWILFTCLPRYRSGRIYFRESPITRARRDFRFLDGVIDARRSDRRRGSTWALTDESGRRCCARSGKWRLEIRKPTVGPMPSRCQSASRRGIRRAEGKYTRSESGNGSKSAVTSPSKSSPTGFFPDAARELSQPIPPRPPRASPPRSLCIVMSLVVIPLALHETKSMQSSNPIYLQLTFSDTSSRNIARDVSFHLIW